MAGFYPDVPSNRIAYDVDGTVLLKQLYNTSQSWVQQDPSVATALNNESTGVGVAGNSVDFMRFCLMFPEPYDVDGLYANVYTQVSGSGAVDWSNDTTNGTDGTWSTAAGLSISISSSGVPLINPAYRTSITTGSISGATALRVRASSASDVDWGRLHIYGKPSTLVDPELVEIWDSTGTARVGGAYFDWGDAPRLGVFDKTFTVKNRSATATANDTVVSAEAATGTIDLAHSFSLDGTNFSSTVSIPSIAAGAASSVVHVRVSLPVDAGLGVWAARIRAIPTTWT